MKVFDDPVKTGLAKTLDAAALRQRVIADNIANVDTPGFKKSVVRFEDALRRALKSGALPLRGTDPRHIGADPLSSVIPQVEQVNTTTLRTDGNNVDVEEEMVNLVTNNLTYQAAVRFITGKFSALKYVISGGR
uniref:Flagellar basal body rod protein FlgB n=1 Tax=Ammonifex degensii TaxID=42838 RepID=A0A7C2E4D2_9THEO